MVDRLSVRRSGHSDRNLYTHLLENAFNRSMAIDGKLSAATLQMEGMSGRSYRLFINNLVSSVPDARYLEIGSWMGSTVCAAMEGNKLDVVCIDNWSQYGGPREVFLSNTGAHISHLSKFRFIESDFRAIDYTSIGCFNIYLFDGPHEYADHLDGITMALPALDAHFFFIVDDWNWKQVRDGTFAAMSTAGLETLFSIEIQTTQDGSHAELRFQESDWHNGYFLAVLRKKNRTSLLG